MRKSDVRGFSSDPVSVEPLECRRMLAASPAPQPLRNPADYLSEHLTAAEVSGILAAAASQAARKQIIVVSDREGVILGSFAMRKIPDAVTRDRTLAKATARARTAAFFESTQDAFTTRTARFIVQDHFPHPVQNTPGGPLYGVEFSTLFGSDVPPASMINLPATDVANGILPLNISGDPGGIPLFKNGIPVGGIGVAGDGRDTAVRQDLIDTVGTQDNPTRAFYNGEEEHDFDEAVALAGARSFMAPPRIRATQIFLEGLRFPFTFDSPASGQPARTLAQLTSANAGSVLTAPIDSPATIFPNATVAGVIGQLKNTNPNSSNFRAVDSDDVAAVKLTKADVEGIIADAVSQAISIRGAIREPQGVAARVHVTVVDRDGTLLGAFRMADGTNFSYDVAVQKARTAAFFSDDTHAFSARAIGFLAQGFFPPGTNQTGPGPLYKIQNELLGANLKGKLKNGITIFPGGVPLYKNGVFVGGVGVSGDGVDQDDLIAFAGGRRFAPKKSIRSDALGEQKIVQFITQKINEIVHDFTISRKRRVFALDRIGRNLDDIRLPYVKFPRNPDL